MTPYLSIADVQPTPREWVRTTPSRKFDVTNNRSFARRSFAHIVSAGEERLRHTVITSTLAVFGLMTSSSLGQLTDRESAVLAPLRISPAEDPAPARGPPNPRAAGGPAYTRPDLHVIIGFCVHPPGGLRQVIGGSW